MSNAAVSDFTVVDVLVEVKIEAPAGRVWEALTADVRHWWPRDFYAGENPVKFVIEPKLGGHMFEDWGDGQGLVWATVTGVRHGALLQLSGELSKDFGGPARTLTAITLKEEGGTTTVALSETVFGRVSEKTAGSMDEGWKHLIGGCMKPFVETGKRCGIEA